MTRRGILLFRLLLGWRIRVENLDRVPMEPCIIAANHQSYLDPVQLWIASGPRVPKAMVGLTNPNIARAFARTFGSWSLPFLGMLPIDPVKPGDSVAGAVWAIGNGFTIGIFPEGTRNRGPVDRLLPARTGVARIALSTGVPIVPVGIVSPPGLTTGQALRNLLFTRRPAIVRFGLPIRYPRTPPDQWTPELIEGIVEDVMRAISALSGRTYTPRIAKTG